MQSLRKLLDFPDPLPSHIHQHRSRSHPFSLAETLAKGFGAEEKEDREADAKKTYLRKFLRRLRLRKVDRSEQDTVSS
jgi:hypothetical protein